MMLPHPSIFGLALLGHIHQIQQATASPAPSPSMTAAPRASASITSTTSVGPGCPANAGGAVISPTSSDNLQTLTFYSDKFTLYSPSPGNTPLDRAKSCNGAISLLYPNGFAFKLEAVTYSVMSNLEREVNAHFLAGYTLSPGTGTGAGVLTTAGEVKILHKWQFNGTGRAQRTFRYYSLPEMVKPPAGEVVPVLSSICGQKGNNAVQVGIDTRVGLESRSTQVTGGILGGPDFELEMVQLHLRWEACK